MNYPTLLMHLHTQQPFAFIRWGDGELRAVLGDDQPNCDGHHRTPQLQKALATVLSQQNEQQTLQMGFQSTLHSSHYRAVFEKKYPNIKWSNADILHNASIEDRLKPFLEAIRDGSTILFTGNKHLFRNITFIDTITELEHNSFYYHSLNDFRAGVEQHKIILFAASMASNVWIAELWAQYPNKTFIDVGSVLDPYAGVVSRAYHWDIVNRLPIPKEKLIVTGSQTPKP